ncbi:hypothetical protein GCM10010424_62040 [Streptomyces lienomycini]
MQRAPPPVVPPQHLFHGTRGTAERGDRVSAAWIAEEEVTEKTGGGAVREDASGTHGSTGRGKGESKRVADEPGTAAAHGDMSSLRVSAPWFEEHGGESSWLPGILTPGHSGGTAPDSHRASSPAAVDGPGSPPRPANTRQPGVDLRRRVC